MTTPYAPRRGCENWPPYGQRTPAKHPGGYTGEPGSEREHECRCLHREGHRGRHPLGLGHACRCRSHAA